MIVIVCAQTIARTVRRWLLTCAIAVLATGCATGLNDLVPNQDMVAVPIGAVGHLGDMVGISEFSLNGHWGGSNGGWGGGGAGMCCVLLPNQVTKPVMVKVKWTTCDISGIKFVDDHVVDPSARCKEDEHEATVPIHFAVQPGDSSGLYVHFLPGLRVEVWVSRLWPNSPKYPGPAFPRGPAPTYAPLPDEETQPASAVGK